MPAHDDPGGGSSSIQGDIHLPNPIAELVDLVASARRNGEDAIRLAPPLSQELSRLHLTTSSLSRISLRGAAPSECRRARWLNTCTGWSACLASLRSSIRSGPRWLSSSPRCEQERLLARRFQSRCRRAGCRHRNQREPQPGRDQPGHSHTNGAAATGGVASTGTVGPDSRPRRWMWWIVGIAAIVAAVAAVVALFLT